MVLFHPTGYDVTVSEIQLVFMQWQQRLSNVKLLNIYLDNYILTSLVADKNTNVIKYVFVYLMDVWEYENRVECVVDLWMPVCCFMLVELQVKLLCTTHMIHSMILFVFQQPKTNVQSGQRKTNKDAYIFQRQTVWANLVSKLEFVNHLYKACQRELRTHSKQEKWWNNLSFNYFVKLKQTMN